MYSRFHGGEELGTDGFAAGQGRFQAGDLRQKMRHLAWADCRIDNQNMTPWCRSPHDWQILSNGVPLPIIQPLGFRSLHSVQT